MTLKEDILNAETICIAGHTNPDGDAVSSTLALALAVEQLGKKPYILLEDYSDEFDVLDGRKYIYSLSYDELAPDLFIASDCGDKERLGEAAKVFDRAKKTWNIDHHVSNTSFAQVNVVEPASSSACEVVYETVKDFIKLDKNIATALYTGILTDTGGFRHNSTHKRTHEIAGILVEAGVDTPFIHNKMLMEHTLVQAKVLAQAIENVSFEGSVCISYIDSIQLEKIGADKKDLGAVIDYLITMRGAEVAVFAYERNDGCVKLSFRSKSLDVNKIAAKLGGGGHVLASGASVNNDIESALLQSLQLIREGMQC
ncbi:MAG: bifunctional oligoribonuclease/PAP phosphatase NrnA [Firmicutes bacterium]|nr:bifunctional oligoribonuclease/PAP phosphatase NrnA [Bacillota bacterium]